MPSFDHTCSRDAIPAGDPIDVSTGDSNGGAGSPDVAPWVADAADSAILVPTPVVLDESSLFTLKLTYRPSLVKQGR